MRRALILTRLARLSEFSKPVLAIDSSLGGCVACVLVNGVAYSSTLETEREQALRLMPMVQDVVAKAGITFADIGLIVTSVGPGSFTGLRIGLSAARTMGLSLGIPVQGVSTFEAMARSAVPEKKACMVVLETKRDDFYVQAFDADKNPIGEGACASPDNAIRMVEENDFILCGDGLGRLGRGGHSRAMIDPEVLARAGVAHFLGSGQKSQRPEPVYLRGADVSMSNKIQREIKDLPL